MSTFQNDPYSEVKLLWDPYFVIETKFTRLISVNTYVFESTTTLDEETYENAKSHTRWHRL
jgi:hypothetical protein